jgi:ABC-type xylose transport system substrate-binding protein
MADCAIAMLMETEAGMRWLRRKRRSAAGSLDRAADGSDTAHLEDFARTRRGVEAFVEPPTTMTATTVVLVAHDGEWTRRRIKDAQAAHDLARKLAIPAYDAQVVGYPQRMRDWSRRHGQG